jgi:hypothetical protein
VEADPPQHEPAFSPLQHPEAPAADPEVSQHDSSEQQAASSERGSEWDWAMRKGREARPGPSSARTLPR